MVYHSILPQVECLKEGFYEVVYKKNLIDINPAELEELINGKPVINLKNWIKNTEYKEPYSKKHQIIKWFWKAVETYDQKQLSHLVLFATGTSRIPAGGFAALESNRGEYKKFTIQATDFEGKSDWQYPMAHTCFNRITLPMYPTYEHHMLKYLNILRK